MSELKPPDLRAEAFLLRPWRLDDLDQLVAAVQDPAVPRWTRVPEPNGLADGRAFIEATTKSWKDGTSAPFAVVDAADEQLLGSIGVRFHEEGAASRRRRCAWYRAGCSPRSGSSASSSSPNRQTSRRSESPRGRASGGKAS